MPKWHPKSMLNRALGVPGLSFYGFGKISEEAYFSCFSDRQKVSYKNLKNRACWRPKGVQTLFLGRVCGRGVAHGEVRRGQALRSRRMLPEFPENMRTRRFFGGLGEGEFRGIGRIGIGRVGGRSLDIEKENLCMGFRTPSQGGRRTKGLRPTRRPSDKTHGGS